MTRLHRLDASGGDPGGPATSEARRATSTSQDSLQAAPPDRGADEQLSSLLTASHHAYALQEPLRLIASYVLQLRKACKDQPSARVNQIVACIADRTNQIQSGLDSLTSALDNLCRRELEDKIPPADEGDTEERSGT